MRLPSRKKRRRREERAQIQSFGMVTFNTDHHAHINRACQNARLSIPRSNLTWPIIAFCSFGTHLLLFFSMVYFSPSIIATHALTLPTFIIYIPN